MSQIKSRLQAAYENVEFHASSTWVHGSNAFQKANQELYIRESKVKDALVAEPFRPRTVQDCIPHSKLAQYSNYEYNESRELCYASSATNISFYYPCICKRSSIKEAWMVPEVEQLFVWLSHGPDFNILELLRLEELAHLDEQEKLRSGRNLTRRWKDFHEISPVFYEAFERTPGKPRYTDCSPISQTDLLKFVPSQLKTHTFEDMILRMKILSDKVRGLWSDQSPHAKQPVLEEPAVSLLKSPLGNYFLLDDSQDTAVQDDKQKLVTKTCTVEDHHLKSSDFAQLQSLAESLRILEKLVCNSTRPPTIPSFPTLDHKNHEPPEVAPKTEAPPARRLYSTVLQGLPTDKKQPFTDAVYPTNSFTKVKSTPSVSNVLPTKTTSSCFSMENLSNPPLTPTHKSTPVARKNHFPSGNSPPQCLAQSSHWGAAASTIKSYAQVSQEKKSPPSQIHFTPLKLPCSKSEIPSTPPNLKNLASGTIPVTNSDVCTAVKPNHNVPRFPTKTTNPSSYSLSNAFLGSAYANNNTCLNNTMSSNSNYINNSYCCNSQYPPLFQTSFSNNIYSNNTYQSNQFPSLNSRHVFPQFSRQPYHSNQAHISSPSSMWVIHHSRPSTLYSVAHFTTQPYFLLPPPPPPSLAFPLPPRQNQRWTSPSHFLRTPSTLPSYQKPGTLQHTSSSPSPQHWGMQNESPYRTNSVQNISLSPQQLPEYLPGQGTRGKLKKKSSPATQLDFGQHKARSKSPESSSLTVENPDSVETSETYSNMSMAFSKRSSTASSDVTFSFPFLDKPLLIKSAASTSSLEFKKIKIGVPKNCEFPDGEKRSSATALEGRNENANYLSNEAEERHALPISTTVSEELERQALEQYQLSDENFYQELERQAEEQYDQDRSENCKGPPNERLLFGGHAFGGVSVVTKQCFSFCGVC